MSSLCLRERSGMWGARQAAPVRRRTLDMVGMCASKSKQVPTTSSTKPVLVKAVQVAPGRLRAATWRAGSFAPADFARVLIGGLIGRLGCAHLHRHTHARDITPNCSRWRDRSDARPMELCDTQALRKGCNRVELAETGRGNIDRYGYGKQSQKERRTRKAICGRRNRIIFGDLKGQRTQ